MAKKGSRESGPRKIRREAAPRTLAGRIKAEGDKEWKKWFLDVERRRKALTDPKNARLVVAEYEKDGAVHSVVRRKSEPIAIKKLLRKNTTSYASGMQLDLEALRSTWHTIVPPAIACESEVVSFSRGVLKVSVFSSALLQEIRQFYRESIVQDLRDAWPVATPLLRVQFIMGKR